MLCSSRSKACRGTLRDCGTEVSYSSTTTDGPGEYSIPTQADFLFVYSTIPGILKKKKRPVLLLSQQMPILRPC
jgi:hypothetical protein